MGSEDGERLKSDRISNARVRNALETNENLPKSQLLSDFNVPEGLENYSDCGEPLNVCWNDDNVLYYEAPAKLVDNDLEHVGGKRKVGHVRGAGNGIAAIEIECKLIDNGVWHSTNKPLRRGGGPGRRAAKEPPSRRREVIRSAQLMAT